MSQSRLQKLPSRHFTTANGLTQNSIFDAVFDKSGFLWLATQSDVLIYDGYSFIPYNKIENNKPVSFKSAHLYCCANGDILLLDVDGVFVRQKVDGKLRKITTEFVSKEFSFFQVVAENKAGDLFITSESNSSFYCIRKKGTEYVIDDNLHMTRILTTVSTASDVKRRTNSIWLVGNEQLSLLNLENSKVIKTISTSVFTGKMFYLDFHDTLYACDKQFSIYKNDGEKWALVSKALGPVLNNGRSADARDIRACIFDNSIYLSAGFNSIRIDNLDFAHPVFLATEDGHDFISKGSMLGTIISQDAAYQWLFTNTEGFYQLDIRPKKFNHFKAEDGRLNFIRSVYRDEDNGNILAGMFYGGVIIYDSTGRLIKDFSAEPTKFSNNAGFSVNGITKLDQDQYLIWYDIGMAFILDIRTGKFTDVITSAFHKERNRDHPTLDYGGFLAMEKDNLAVADKDRIFFVSLNKKKITTTDSVIMKESRPEGFIYQAPDFYYNDKGYVYQRNMLTKAVDSFSLPTQAKVKWMSIDKQKRFWIATETGIVVIDKNKTTTILTLKDGLPNEHIYIAEPDEQGNIWCSSNKGIFKINGDNFSVTSYSTLDGLQSEEFNTGAFSRDHFGNMYFGGINGFNFFNPANIEQKENNDLVYITAVTSTDSLFYQYPSALLPKVINLTYRNPKLQIKYTALNYKTPGFNQYEYRLGDNDTTWIDNENNNEIQLVFLVGSYNIQIRLKNNPASLVTLRVVIHPPFYKTRWFLALVSLSLLGIIILLVNWYNRNKYRKKIERLEMQQQVQQEKERISRDLHDHLGVQANAILYNTELLMQDESRPAVVSDLHDTAKEMMLSLRETIWAMKKADTTAMDIWLRVISFSKQMGKHYTAVQFSALGESPQNTILPSAKALNLLMLVQEAVNNAIKHAHAKNIVIRSAILPNAWQITVEDDGEGFDLNQVSQKNDSYGLNNMQERAKNTGADLQIIPQMTKGTRIIITLAV